MTPRLSNRLWWWWCLLTMGGLGSRRGARERARTIFCGLAAIEQVRGPRPWDDEEHARFEWLARHYPQEAAIEWKIPPHIHEEDA